ncbi:MAG: hypothetical protein WBA23_16580 [Tunicatimonas sp.]|uniref:hypothetical protein n=1 Tax=Tunicatimonas sp. TaxID=1940096 RepID=UPI003C724956
MKTVISFSLIPILFIALLWMTSCASSKTMAYDPAGTWNYSVTGTPNGTVDGTFVISKNGDAYAGELRSSQGNITLEDLTIEGQALKAVFDYSGTELTMNGMFEGDTFDGEVAAGYDSFDMTASRAN